MEEFHVPEDLGEPSALQVKTAGRFCASQDLPILRNESKDRLNDIVDSVRSRLVDDGDADALSEQENFDDMFTLVRDFKYLPSEIKGRVLSILHEVVERIVRALEGGSGGNRRGRRSERGVGDKGPEGGGGGNQQGQAEVPLRNAFKMSVYLLFSAAFPSEECYASAKQTAVLGKAPARGKGSRGGGSGGKKSSSSGSDTNGSFEWENARQAVLETMRLALTVEPSRLWRQGVPDRCFMGLFLRLTCKMLELPETSKNARQSELVLRLISEPFHLAQGMETEFSAAIFLLVRENRHLADFVAKLCCHLVERHADARLGAELVREIGRMDMPDINSKNAAAAAPVVNVSEFLRQLVVVLPGTVYAHTSVLLPHLSSRPYQIRLAVVMALGEVVSAAHEDRTASSEVGEEGGSRDGGSDGAAVGEDESQVQADPRRVRMKDRNRDALLDQLVERALDVSPFVRLAVLRAWASIAERGALPRMRFLIAARLGRDRLHDQSSLVRKEAVKLLSTLFEYNPYDSALDLETSQQRSKQAEAELRAMTPAPTSPAQGKSAAEDGDDGDLGGSSGDGNNEGPGQEGEGDERDGEGSDLEEKETSEKVKDTEGDVDMGEGGREEEEEEEGGGGGGDAFDAPSGELSKEQEALAVKAAQCHHLRAAVLFIEELQEAGVRVEGLLGSATVSDVVEALRYFVTACHFRVTGAVEAIKKSLTLIWRTEPQIEAAIKHAFVQVFIQPEAKDGELEGERSPAAESSNAQFVAKNLVNLVNESKAGELASLEEVVVSLMKDTLDRDKDTVLDPEVFEQLWCAVARKEQLPKARAGALHAIAMGSSADPSLVNDKSRLEVIRETALGRSTMESRDWRTVRCACIALLRCDAAVVMSNTEEVELILKRLIYFLQGKWCVVVSASTSEEDRANADAEMTTWFAAAEQAIAVIFHLNRSPEALGASVVRRMAADTFSSDEASPHALARLCFVLGDLALKLLVYSEDLAGSLERSRAKIKPPEKKAGNGSDDNDDDATAQELGLNAEVAAEDEQRLSELVEKEIVGRNLLGAFGPLLVRLVANEEGRFSHPLLRESSVLALSKFMCISEAFCERNLSLLFTTLERSKDTAVRANIIVALGDLAFRFPNALEPWNHCIYDRLKDDSAGVRANTIMVLTHLILNDMVKVKGQVSGLAVCMVDEEPRIQDAAKVFFHKYSERGSNPVYNVLPDIVGRLSVDETIAPSEFREIMDFLMQFVKKDKLTEMLGEKLCARLAASETTRQARAVSYCLGQLKVTEKAVSRLAELVPTYKHKLKDEEVFKNFMVVVSRTKSFATSEMKEAVAEWQTQLSKYHEGGAEDEDAAARAASAAGRRRSHRQKRSSASSSSSSLPSSSGGSQRGGRKKERGTAGEEIEEEEAGGTAECERTTNPKKTSTRHNVKKKKEKKKKSAAVLLSSDDEHEDEHDEEDSGGNDDGSSDGDDASEAEDNDSDDGDFPKRKARSTSRVRAEGQARRGRRCQRVVEEEDEDENEDEEEEEEGGEGGEGEKHGSRRGRKANRTSRGRQGTAMEMEESEDEEEEAKWGSEKEVFETKSSAKKKKTKKAEAMMPTAVSKETTRRSASKENRSRGKVGAPSTTSTAAERRSRRSRDVRPLSPKNC